MAIPTWRPHPTHGPLTAKQESDLPDSAFAFPGARKEPLTDASHVRDAMSRFGDVPDVSDVDRELAFANIRKAAAYLKIEMPETDWRQLGTRPSTARRSRT
jgi:hypothetical protein